MEREFTCVWCKHTYKESEITHMTHSLFLGEYPNTCVCEHCFVEWTDNLLFKYKQLKDMCKEYNKCSLQSKWQLIMNLCEDENEI